MDEKKQITPDEVLDLERRVAEARTQAIGETQPKLTEPLDPVLVGELGAAVSEATRVLSEGQVTPGFSIPKKPETQIPTDLWQGLMTIASGLRKLGAPQEVQFDPEALLRQGNAGVQELVGKLAGIAENRAIAQSLGPPEEPMPPEQPPAPVEAAPPGEMQQLLPPM